MSGRDWIDAVRTRFQYPARAAKGLTIRWEPGPSGTEAGMTMAISAAKGNMQTDAAAFETWALALRASGADRVTLALDAPDASPNDGHLNRFRYRVARFSALFDWFHTANGLGRSPLESPDNAGMSFLLNVEGEPRKAGGPGKGKDASPALDAGESHLEEAIVDEKRWGGNFRTTFGLKTVDRQLPVGLFRGEVKREAEYRVFTGGKSCVDLWGLDGDKLYLFELKNKENRKLGALSELFLYAMLLRDLQNEKIIFDPKPRAAHEKADRPYLRIKKTRSIEAVILAPDFHPLIKEAETLKLLNEAFKARKEPVRFSLCRLETEGRFQRL